MKTKLTKAQAKKLVANRNRRVSKENKLFDSLTPAEKRVYIARDVLKHLATKKLVAEPGVWLEGEDYKSLFKYTEDRSKEEQNSEVRDILNKQKSCIGCALGGMFMCAVKVANKLKLKELSSESDTVMDQLDVFKYMRRFFSKNQLTLIESAFERGAGAVPGTLESRGFLADEDVDPELQMKMIMQNIIKHKGTFVPTDRPKRTYVMDGFQE